MIKKMMKKLGYAPIVKQEAVQPKPERPRQIMSTDSVEDTQEKLEKLLS